MGVPVGVTVAAATGRLNDLARFLNSDVKTRSTRGVSVAVINRQLEAARMCLGAVPDVNAYSEVHRHSMPIHQAAGNGDVPMLKCWWRTGRSWTCATHFGTARRSGG